MAIFPEYYTITPQPDKNQPFGYAWLTTPQIKENLEKRKVENIPKGRKEMIQLAEKHTLSIHPHIVKDPNKEEPEDLQQLDEFGAPLWIQATCGEWDCVLKMQELAEEYAEMMYGYGEDFDPQDLYFTFFECEKEGCHTMGVKNEMTVCHECGDRICCDNHMGIGGDGECTDCFKETD